MTSCETGDATFYERFGSEPAQGMLGVRANKRRGYFIRFVTAREWFSEKANLWGRESVMGIKRSSSKERGKSVRENPQFHPPLADCQYRLPFSSIVRQGRSSDGGVKSKI
jgi:hypothetical protein